MRELGLVLVIASVASGIRGAFMLIIKPDNYFEAVTAGSGYMLVSVICALLSIYCAVSLQRRA